MFCRSVAAREQPLHRHGLGDADGAGGATLAHEAAGKVDRNAAVGAEFARRDCRAAHTFFGETESFKPLYLGAAEGVVDRSEEHTSELQSLMRNTYAVFCLKKKTQ